ncbi:hypothetical protein ACWEQ0_19380 [Nocardia thailandica]
MSTTLQDNRMEVLLPQALDPAALDSLLRLHVEAALARTGRHLVAFDHGPSQPSSPGVACWPVTYTSDADETARTPPSHT